LARYRKLSSHFGGYFDKVTDSFGWAALYGAAAVAGLAATDDAWVAIVPLAGVTGLGFQGITYWLERDLLPPSAPVPLTPRRSPLTLVGWLSNWWRLALFEEPDYYVWISVALLSHRFRELSVVIAVTFGLRVTALSLVRLRYAHRVWRGVA
jgi:phosphatidylglycerophosphate synthase